MVVGVEAEIAMGEVRKKLVKRINVDVDKCIGCCACEVACSGFHASPKFSSFNPAKSRIRMVVDELKDLYVPVRSTDYTKAECTGRQMYKIDGKEYSECSFCGSICPCRDYFKDPDSGLPLKCDMCIDDPPVTPMCVQVCRVGALTYEEYEEEALEEEVKREGADVGLEALVNEYGWQKVMEAAARMSKKG
jgi:benzoyl-CoA reductase subunit BamC